MAMKRYRQGRDYSELLQLLSWSNPPYKDGTDPREVAEHHVWIDSGDMIFRFRGTWISSKNKEGLFFEKLVCPHIHVSCIGWAKVGTRLNIMWRYVGELPYTAHPCEPAEGIKECKYCSASFDIRILSNEAETTATLTSWRNLGQAIDLADQKWLRNLRKVGYTDMWRYTAKRCWCFWDMPWDEAPIEVASFWVANQETRK
ncbi:hypothetical protein F5884DRAFT_776499 [Xylogone sp. PMI_703]|nr:hypothetical protein F5884DRAFT_776499 [Xylogone sp. PMI_703]